MSLLDMCQYKHMNEGSEVQWMKKESEEVGKLWDIAHQLGVVFKSRKKIL